MPARGLPTGERPRFDFSTKLLFAVGAMANAVKMRGLSTFLLIFYNQVVGLPAAMVATAIMIALIWDAFVDPTVGQISDNTRSRWGRRHPYMYAAAVPVSVAFFFLWNPPAGWGQEALFAYMLAILLIIRLFDTFFELPSSTLIPELAPEYNARTNLISLRFAIGVIAGLTMTILAYQVFMKEQPDGTGGIIAREGYFGYALTSAILIFVSILISTASTHKFIPWLRPPPERKLTPAVMFKEMFSTLNNRSFIVLTGAGMFTAIAGGMKNAVEIYFNLYYWGLTQAQLSVLVVAGVVASVAGVSLAPILGAKLGKQRGAIIAYTSALAVGITPIVLRMMGLAPENGTTALFVLLFVETIINGALAICTGILLASMIADVVEDSEVKTGRRSEGLLMSADNLFKKMVSGVGVFAAGLMLTWVNFPQNAKRGAVDPAVLDAMAWAYLPLAVFLYGMGIVGLFFLRVSKERHDQNLATLRERAARVGDAEQEGEAAVAEAGGLAGQGPPGPSSLRPSQA